MKVMRRFGGRRSSPVMERVLMWEDRVGVEMEKNWLFGDVEMKRISRGGGCVRKKRRVVLVDLEGRRKSFSENRSENE